MSIIAIIGPDGSGKTTQAMMLVDRLKKAGYHVIYVKPNYFLLNFFFRLKIDDIHCISPRKDRVTPKRISRSWLSQIRNLVAAPLGFLYTIFSHWCMVFVARNRIIVCDRYFYQLLYDLFGGSIYKFIPLLPKAHSVFFLNTHLNVIYSRMQSSFDKKVLPSYYNDIIAFMRELKDRKSFFEIDASLKKETINDYIFEYVTKCVQLSRANKAAII